MRKSNTPQNSLSKNNNLSQKFTLETAERTSSQIKQKLQSIYQQKQIEMAIDTLALQVQTLTKDWHQVDFYLPRSREYLLAMLEQRLSLIEQELIALKQANLDKHLDLAYYQRFYRLKCLQKLLTFKGRFYNNLVCNKDQGSKANCVKHLSCSESQVWEFVGEFFDRFVRKDRNILNLVRRFERKYINVEYKGKTDKQNSSNLTTDLTVDPNATSIADPNADFITDSNITSTANAKVNNKTTVVNKPTVTSKPTATDKSAVTNKSTAPNKACRVGTTASSVEISKRTQAIQERKRVRFLKRAWDKTLQKNSAELQEDVFSLPVVYGKQLSVVVSFLEDLFALAQDKYSYKSMGEGAKYLSRALWLIYKKLVTILLSESLQVYIPQHSMLSKYKLVEMSMQDYSEQELKDLNRGVKNAQIVKLLINDINQDHFKGRGFEILNSIKVAYEQAVTTEVENNYWESKFLQPQEEAAFQDSLSNLKQVINKYISILETNRCTK
ncbi:hypothetical protein [Psittacicella hinzii]|uniref:Uncharacterized protein n=1 Tax=Psittacicella hinzii TaxID=2028575 RepID=A0A3A1YRJ7_9GAMM|nr:hypothetical protein [Psittacicella hinzii]RIY38647.1 hypothetical protein CKF58_03715 [Psittacicella hinzii]